MKITLRSSDDKLFEVNEAAAMKSGIIKFIIEDAPAGDVIPVAEVNSKTLAKVLEYCERHAGDQETATEEEKEELRAWNEEYMKVDQEALYYLFMASNYMNIKGLVELAAETAASWIKGKKPEEIRKTFNIKNDFTPEQEEELRKDHEWAFD